jgi:hypothetical protein
MLYVLQVQQKNIVDRMIMHIFLFQSGLLSIIHLNMLVLLHMPHQVNLDILAQ